MANIIAVIWDFDKTLVDGYMQDPIFREYGVDGTEFWKEVGALPEKYKREQNVNVNRDTIYLNHFINCAKPGGIFEGLNNAKLRGYGSQLDFYKGIPEIFDATKRMIEEDPRYREYNIRVEHYIVSTGFKEVIEGTPVRKYVERVWGCELIEGNMPDGTSVISEIGYTIDNTTKTRAIFEINKGPGIDVNAKMPEELRRIRFENMIYIADGPSDIPAFSLVRKEGGSTLAIYPSRDEHGFAQVERMRRDGRIDMYAEADYSEGTTAYMWICSAIKRRAERIYQSERHKITGVLSEVPKHLNE
ncbi:MAG: haloacid dehalogenase-like hydrolase [Lachnospiraceae bacterium]|nr:haloacid dehalogenase-like hydrolase [Lachnospiraceae bacterium]